MAGGTPAALFRCNAADGSICVLPPSLLPADAHHMFHAAILLPADAMCGVTASLWAAIPPVRHLLLAITG